MGCVMRKSATNPCDDSMDQSEKVRVLEEEVEEMRRGREVESQAYEEQATEFVTREAEWKREKKKWKEEVGRLRKKLEDKDERLRVLEEETATPNDTEWQFSGTNFLVEHMIEEQALREEAVEKWKRLYLAIKAELDDLIHRTRPGERLRWGAVESGIIEGLQRELMAKEETVEVLRERLAAMENEVLNKEREIDILRQSLRIMSNSKKIRVKNNRSQSLHL